ncbi:MAG: amidase [Candidatus Peregrinibacteria bacterium Gr01-1014_25]|nr:MAG: amidase [Candidatus Peregrinibacteria bacterium Gr01-1014_25]
MRRVFLSLTSILGTIGIVASQNAGATFSDTGRHPYEESIRFVQEEGIVQGYPDGTYRPDIPINRAEFVKIIIAAASDDIAGANCFPDVNKEWFAPFVCTAKSHGLVGGYPDGMFKPDRNVLFAEAAKIIAAAFDLPTSPDAIWYKPFVDALRTRNAVPPSIRDPGQKLTRGEMAAVLHALAGGTTTSSDRGLDDFDVSQAEQKEWERRIDAALTPASCPDVPPPVFPKGYYTGPLIDTHLHVPAIDDSSPGSMDDEEREPEGRFGGPMAILGENTSMSKIACTLKQEGTTRNFAFFPVYDEIPKQAVQIARRTMQAYPEFFTPFLMTPGPDDEVPTLDAPFVENVLSYYPGLFEGYGEIGLYDIEGVRGDFPPDAALFEDIYPIVKRNKLLVYFHPGEGHRKNFERVLAAEPDLTFIVHGEEIEGDIGALMEKYPNIYFTADDILVSYLFPLYVGKSKEAFVTALEKDFASILAKAEKKWKPVIEAHPDRFLWGTDRGDAVWNYDPDIGRLLVRYARAFIGRLDPKVQEKFAYKNAEALLQKAATMKDHAVSIGYIGCSNTRQTVEGYQRLGGTKMWPYEKRYDGGAVRDWAQDAERGNKYWDVFDELLEEHPNTRAVWWQLCIRQEDDTKYDDTVAILAEIRKRIPGVKVYVSPLPGYTTGVCGITGTVGIEKAKELAGRLDSEHADVFAGPVLGPMTPADTEEDGCHLSIPDGLRKLGTQMLEFFE